MTTHEKEQFMQLLPAFMNAREDTIKEMFQQAGIKPEHTAAKVLLGVVWDESNENEFELIIARTGNLYFHNLNDEIALKYPHQIAELDEYYNSRPILEILEEHRKKKAISAE